MNTFFTSDTHFGHSNIVRLSKRPYSSVEEHDKALINNWNKVVGKNDLVYHLGDFAFKSTIRIAQYREQLNGSIILIEGNHDHEAAKNRHLFQSYHKVLEIKINGKLIVLNHYAQRVWNKSHYGSWHLYGHSHGTLPDDPNSLSFDAGVDCWNYTPLSFDQVYDILSKKKDQILKTNPNAFFERNEPKVIQTGNYVTDGSIG